MNIKTIVFLLGSLAISCQNFAQICNYLAYEPFDNTAGTALEDYAGGAGWAGGWEVQNGNSTVPGYQFETGNLALPNLQTFGNSASAGVDYLTAGRSLDISSTGPFATYLNSSGHIGKDGTTLWFSALIQKNNDNSNHSFVELNGDPIGWVIQSWEPHIGIGYYGSDSDLGSERRWSLRVGDVVYPTSETVAFGAPILAVFSVIFNSSSSHTIDLFINPVLGASPPVTPTISQSFSGNLWFQSIAIKGDSPGEAHYDEIRFANSFECVAPANGVAVNLPPTAVITASTTDGAAPLSISLDAAASLDPNGSIVNYEWDFGDGSALFNQSSPTSFSHTFNNLGITELKLKVTDNHGSTHLISQNIIVRNPTGTFTCQSGANLTPATCGQNNGAIRVNTWNGMVQSHNLVNSSGTPFTANANDIYENLTPGNYTLSISGIYSCSDTYNLVVVVDSSTCAAWSPAICRTDLGMNLNFPTYFTTERPFKNLFRFNGGFYTVDASTPWIPTGQYNVMPKDADGYPLQVPWSNGAGSHLVKVVVSDNGYFPTQTLVVLYDGTGTIQCTAPMQNITSGRFEIVVSGNTQILFDILSSQLGDHIKNIRVLRPEDEFDDLVTSPFHDGFLNRLEPFRAIRFMNWMNINNSNLSTWSQRTLLNSYNQSNENMGGVAYEYIIDLCNTLQRDAWICLPHQVDDNYITQLGQLFNNTLDPNLNIYIEYSNEVWNWGFTQSHFVTDNGAQNISYPRRYAEKATEAMNLFRNQFGGAANRVKRVLGTQLTFNWVSHEILAHVDPADYEYFSPSSYFGWSGGSCEGSLNAASTALDVINCTRTTFLEQMASWKEDYFNAKMYGVEIINYESGNHMTNFNPSVPFAQAIRDAQTHPEIYNLYQEVIDTLRQLDSRLSMYFVLAARLGNSVDVFGHLDHIDQEGPFLTTAPKYQVLLDNIDDCYTLTALPVELTELRGIPVGDKTELSWGTASENQNLGFEIERSGDGLNWQKLDFVEGAGSSNYYISYRYLDNVPNAGVNYYRLKQIDFNGDFTYSNIVTVIFEKDFLAIKLYPNPTTDFLYFSKKINGNVLICNTLGQVVWNKYLHFEDGIEVSHLPKGNYFLRIWQEGQVVYSGKMLKE